MAGICSTIFRLQCFITSTDIGFLNKSASVSVDADKKSMFHMSVTFACLFFESQIACFRHLVESFHLRTHILPEQKDLHHYIFYFIFPSRLIIFHDIDSCNISHGYFQFNRPIRFQYVQMVLGPRM